jgi:hypothetical protein
MLSHCANPRCSRPFLRLRQGKLFLVETECVAKSGKPMAPAPPQMRRSPRHVERYWLCDQCAEAWTLVHERSRGVVLVPLRRAATGSRVTMGEEYRDSA